MYEKHYGVVDPFEKHDIVCEILGTYDPNDLTELLFAAVHKCGIYIEYFLNTVPREEVNGVLSSRWSHLDVLTAFQGSQEEAVRAKYFYIDRSGAGTIIPIENDRALIKIFFKDHSHSLDNFIEGLLTRFMELKDYIDDDLYKLLQHWYERAQEV